MLFQKREKRKAGCTLGYGSYCIISYITYIVSIRNYVFIYEREKPGEGYSFAVDIFTLISFIVFIVARHDYVFLHVSE